MQEERKIELHARCAAVTIDKSRLWDEHALAQETLRNHTEHVQEIAESRTSEWHTAQHGFFEQIGLEQEIDLARQEQQARLPGEVFPQRAANS